MSILKITSIISTGLIFLSFNACAARHIGGNINFASLDSDNNGQITLLEFKNNAPSMGRSPEFIFNRLDENKDGFISVEEFEKRKEGGGRPSGGRPE